MRGAIVALERQWYRHAASDRRTPSFWTQLQRFGAQVANWLSTSDEPRIWTRTDRLGRVWWYARDPVTGNSLAQASEQDVRAWIEERYHS